MSTSELKAAAAAAVSIVTGPTIEWLEPKLPDILKNGGPLDSFSTEGGLLEGGLLERGLLEQSATEPCSFSGVRTQNITRPKRAFHTIKPKSTDMRLYVSSSE